MIKFVLGKSGSGKTKWLIDQANQDVQSGNGNIVFIDVDDSHIFSLDHSVRLINAKDFRITTTELLFGFLSGIVSKDYDIEKIYIDGIYDVIKYDEETYTKLYKQLVDFSNAFDVDFFFGLNMAETELPELLKQNLEILNS